MSTNSKNYVQRIYSQFQILGHAFQKISIVLLIGCYVYEDAEYVTLVQTILISSSERDYVLTPEDLLSSSSLLIYSAAIIADSYISNNQSSRESFMMARQLYNGVTNNKNIESKVIVSYKNENNRYNAMKNNLKKTVLFVIGRISEIEFDENLDDEEDAAFISDNDPTELVEVRIQEVIPEIKEKHGKNLHSSKK
ncbi:hypothetical protein C2G38_2207795 [Gigaspora rosea]|uniref:Uncharacterized protein n=1 Tax=Gigaspora rosea TaxID=44941 RepID=A0A397URJ7_9GLOM|nr:hypothetical protein C2G38_2207795 [Gigaspora rosea]